MKIRKIAKKSFILFLCLSLFFPFITFSPVFAGPSEERTALEQELKELEALIAQYDSDIKKTEAEKKNLANQISVLKKKIGQLNLQISQSNLMIKDLSLQVQDTQGSISQTTLKIEESKIQLAQILQTIYEENQKPLIEILFAEENLSGFFENLMSLETVNLRNKELLDTIKTLKVSLEGQKESLEDEKSELESVVKLKTLQKKESETIQKQTDSYLKLTEAEYQDQLQKKQTAQKKAAEIKARIFELIGVPKAPTFGEAYEIAKYVGSITGVRPALLLAVLTQESSLGKNVGQCYVKNFQTGSGVNSSGKSIASIMKPTRDITPFLAITKDLGRDPSETPVSCPMSYGYGGAMGPAQFIPSTWVLYQNQVRNVTGSAPNPWDIRDAFLGAGFYLAKYGATSKTDEGEWRAAMIYFAGTVNVKYRFYGDSVLKIAKGYADDIAALEGN